MIEKTQIHAISLNDTSTVIAKFVPNPKDERYYESEANLERHFIAQLQKQGYEYAKHIKDEIALIANLKTQMEQLNECEFSDSEWQRLLSSIIAKQNDSIVDKTTLIQENHLHSFEFDNGNSKNIMLVDKQNLHRNMLQVVNQYNTQTNERKNRYDVTILVNGLPLVHIELKRRGVKLKNAFEQIQRYGRESFFAGSGLFNFVQIFVISNGTYSKYYSNTTRDRHIKERDIKGNDSFEFTSFWADFENRQIFDLVDFTQTFLAKHALLNVLFRYCVFDTTKNLLVMRPYQIAATEAIIRKIKMALHYNKCGSDKANGYIWHSTGSGKTLTSFKTAQLACEIAGIEKVLFVVDRKDLDSQTVSEYNKFEKGCVEQNKSTKMLEKQLQDTQRKIIVTTIQKLSVFVKNNKGHFLFDKPCVIIFDECHRSQFGEMNTLIKKAFRKYLLFGFTGTPILEANKAGNAYIKQNDSVVKVGQTTNLIFNELLHSYTIANAIKDKNVLPFKVDYNNLVSKFRDAERLFEIDEEKKPNKQVLNHPERIKEIVSYVLKNFDKKTYRSGTYTTAQNKRIQGFNSIFASSSIESAKLYYEEFRAQNQLLPTKDRLKIATIFSYSQNGNGVEWGDEWSDESLEDTQKLPKNSRDFLQNAIGDYNGIFGTNYDINAESFAQYYVDLSRRMKNKELDMLIVVDMFLTGFDAKTLNTLWVDKNLRYHGLLQAYSRTNRILDSTKQFGNIVCFRDLEKATEQSILLFSKKGDDSNVVLMRSFKEYFEGYYEEVKKENGETMQVFHKGYIQIVENLKQNFTNPLELDTLEDKKAFIKAYNELLKIENVLSVFDEFSRDKRLISEREKQDLQSVYLQFKDELIAGIEEQEDLEDIVFEVELLKQVDINIDFIYELLAKAKDESNEEKREQILQEIEKWVDSSLRLRGKGDLIKEFARYFVNLDNSANNEDFIDAEFKAFVKQKKTDELAKIVENEGLNAIKTKEFVQKSFKNGEISDLGVDFREILPKSSLFAPNNAHKDKRVFGLLKGFYEKYRDISESEA